MQRRHGAVIVTATSGAVVRRVAQVSTRGCAAPCSQACQVARGAQLRVGPAEQAADRGQQQHQAWDTGSTQCKRACVWGLRMENVALAMRLAWWAGRLQQSGACLWE